MSYSTTLFGIRKVSIAPIDIYLPHPLCPPKKSIPLTPFLYQRKGELF
jgi:hypothetical protein